MKGLFIMSEYKSKYINKTWDEITTSFDWVNCQSVIHQQQQN
ncbi:hypothetical protein [Spiroplasma sp. ChiS]|nr:hypothetical protein [Spiroplasma sp. ChiS]